MIEVWFRLENPSSDGASALAFVRERLEDVADGDSTAWRWIVLGLHLALQDFVVASFPNNLVAMDEGRAAQFVGAMEEGVSASELPELRIDWFPNLYERMKEVTGFDPGDEVDRLLIGGEGAEAQSLHSLRNEVVHHFPGSSSISVLLLLECAEAALSVIDYLGWTYRYTNHVFWHDEAARNQARQDLVRCQEVVDMVRTQLQSEG